jgi:Na+/proline symporter
MKQAHLQIADWAVLLCYLGGITAFGVLVSRRVRDTSGFFLGNRRFGKAVMIAQAMGTGTHSDQAVGVAGAAYTMGLAGIWYQWMWLFTTPFYWLLAPVYRRLRVVTLSDFFELRFGRPYATAYALFAIYILALWQGIAIKGTTVTVSAITGIPEWRIAVVVASVFAIYGISGGLVAAATTDFVQGFFIVFLSFLVLPFGLVQVGGFHGLRAHLDPAFFHVFSSAGGELAPFTVLMLVVSGLVGITVQPHMMAVASSGKTEWNCRVGWTFGNFIKRLCTVGWTLTGVVAAVLYPGLGGAGRERAFGVAVTNLLPAGLVGLMVASLLATVMASCSAFMVDGAALFTRNVYRPYISQNRPDSHYLRVGRCASFAITLLGFVLGVAMPSVVSATVHFVTILPFVGVAFWVGIVWTGANRYGAWASSIGSAVLFFTCQARGISTPWASLYSLAFGFTSIVMVSLATPREPQTRLDRVFHFLDTPVGEEGRLLSSGFHWETEE